MNAEEILSRDDFRKCMDFHGHLCPGLSLGYVAGKRAMEWIEENKSKDEEVVAIVENDACFVDAVQVLTGCTFGKGNFIYKDYGKIALTLLSRSTGRGVRLCLKPGAFSPDEEHYALLQKMIRGEANQEEKKRFQKIHTQRSHDLLATPFDDLFVITAVDGPLPSRAQIHPSEVCGKCGEPTMATRMIESNGEKLCRACSGA